MIFNNREDAAQQLLRKLSIYKNQRPLVLAIPRGAVPMAKIIADNLQGDLDVVLVRKLRAPDNEELALGAVDETGSLYLNDEIFNSYSRRMDNIQDYLASEKERQLKVMQHRRASYSPLRAPINPEGRRVIVVDDGLATGSTMIAALRLLRGKLPHSLTCAVPVAPLHTLTNVKSYCDKCICLSTPEHFRCVGQFYRSFPQVSDTEVMTILA